MNQTDRQRMGRLYGAIAGIRFPNPTATLGIEDVCKFFHAMKKITPQILCCVMDISRCDCPDSEPEQELDELEILVFGKVQVAPEAGRKEDK